MKYAKMDWGKMEAVVNKLGGMEGVERFLSNVGAIQTFEPSLQIWRTVKVGVGPSTISGFVKSLRARKIVDAYHVQSEDFQISENEVELDLVKVSGADLGFSYRGATCDIFARVQKLGLQLCPKDVAPQILLQMTDEELQEEGGGLVASEPVIKGWNAYGRSAVWCLGFSTSSNSLHRRLWTHEVGIRDLHEGVIKWIFVKPRR